jgi:hypothetical protein
MRRSSLLALGCVALLATAPRAAAQAMPGIQGTWELDTKHSQNIPDAARGVDLKISLKGRELMTQRLVDGAPVGTPFTISLDGVPREREIVPGQRGQVGAEWKADGKLIVQTIKMKTGVLDTVQVTNITVSEDGDVMTRVQTTKTGAGTTDRVLIYRKKK